MKFELDNYHRNLPEGLLIEDLITVAQKLDKPSVTHEEYNLNGKYSSNTYIRRFGSWFSALEKAGLQKTRTPANIPEEDLFENLEEIWMKLGRQPRYAEVQKPLSKYHAGTYENRFGSWRKALEAFVRFVNEDEQEIISEEINTDSDVPSSEDKEVKHKTKRNINWRLRFIIMKRDNFKCQKCGRSPATDPAVILHVDHIKPYSKGGETIPENLQTLCSMCNIGKSDLE